MRKSSRYSSSKTGGKRLSTRSFRPEDVEKAVKARASTHSGQYTVRFLKTFDRLSEDMVELRLTYAVNLISDHIGLKPEFIKTKLKKESPSGVGQEEMHYVYFGTRALGKVSISILRLASDIRMTVIYQEKVGNVKKDNPERRAQNRRKELNKPKGYGGFLL